MDGVGIAYAVCGIADIPNRRAKGFSLLRLDADGREVPWHIVLVRWDRRIHGYVNRCPHHGTQLDWEPSQFLDPSGPRLICGKHGALFDIATGACVAGPCQREQLEALALKLVDGDVCVTGVTLAEDV